VLESNVFGFTVDESSELSQCSFIDFFRACALLHRVASRRLPMPDGNDNYKALMLEHTCWRAVHKK
jgi:hypothetical protein